MASRLIGVLALQGNFTKHINILHQLAVKTKEIRLPEDLKNCDSLILPGGESTTLSKLMILYGLHDGIKNFAQKYPVMGTCAGMIMLAQNVDDNRIKPLNLIDIDVSRNAYGTQINSFTTDLSVPFFNGDKTFHGVFIRAPKIARIGRGIKTLIRRDKTPVMVRNNNVLVLSFHPELTNDTRIHNYFLTKF